MKLFWSLLFISYIFIGCIFTPLPEQKVNWQKIDTIASNPLIKVAKAQVGVPYRYGGMTPRGFDCSGFVCYVYEEGIGKKLPRTAKAQSRYAKIVDVEELLPGDILFFDTSNRGEINHTGIYIGDGKFIHASSGKVYAVTISSFKKGFYKRAFRFGARVE